MATMRGGMSGMVACGLGILALAATGCGGGSGKPHDALPDAADVAEVAETIADMSEAGPDAIDETLADVPETADGTDDAVETSDAADAETGPEVAPFAGPKDDVLRLNHLQVKGTHNSYHIAMEGGLPQWNFTHPPLDEQLEQHGVRSVELDVHWDPDLPGFTVHHIPDADPLTTCATFQECLGIVKAWSDAHPGHAPLFLLIEPKDEFDLEPITSHYDDLDAEILAVWPRDRVIVPDDVRGAHAKLLEAIRKDGWPTLAQARGKALFLMLDSSTHRDGYLAGHEDLHGRVLFLRGDGTQPWCGFIEINSQLDDPDRFRQAVSSGCLVRTTADDVEYSQEKDRAKAEASMRLGAHIISSDFEMPSTDGSYWFDLTHGTPVRCNPVTAPWGCQARAIENLTPDRYPAQRVHPTECLADPGCPFAMVSCHRGDHQAHPENSLAGVLGVAQLGAHAAEVDVRETLDGVLVLMHDAEVDRTTDGTGKVEEMTFDQIQALTLEGPGGDGPDDRKIPLFLDALKIAKANDIALYVDLKDADLDRLLDVIANGEGGPYYAQAWVRNDTDNMSALRQKDPNVIVMPYVQSADDFGAVLAAIPDVKIVEMWVGAPDPTLAGLIRAAGVKITQDVMGTGDVFALYGDYSMWGQFVDSGVDLPQTDWPAFLVPAVAAFNYDGVFPAEGPPAR